MNKLPTAANFEKVIQRLKIAITIACEIENYFYINR